MKNIVSATLILKFSHSSLFRSHRISLSSSSSFCSFSLSKRNYDDENRNVKVTVWWDFENCNIPVGVNVHRVSSRITWAVRSSGIKGPISITAFGDVAQLSRATQEALTSTGICFNHVPSSGKNSSDRSFLVDIVYWVYQNPPPAHFFLISGDKDFANILHRLRMSNYNILLASTETASGVLCSAATIMWPWNGLVRGDNITVRHFNHPPDGLYGSWYGHYKGILDDPFADTDHPTTSQTEESMESISESKPRPVPRVVVNAIRQVLHSYPEGISLTELRFELKRRNITIDKDFFGYKKFSLFLSSLNLLKLSGDRQSLAVGTFKKGAEQLDIMPRSSKEVYANSIYKDNGFTRKGDLLVEKTWSSTEHPSSCKESNLDANYSASILSKLDRPVVDSEACRGASVPLPAVSDPSDGLQQRDDISAKEGILNKQWKTLLGHGVGSALKKDDNILFLDSSRNEDSSKDAPNMQNSDHFKKMKPKVVAADPNNNVLEKESSEMRSLDEEKSITKDNDTLPTEKSSNVHEHKVGLFGRILRWSKSWIYGVNEQDDHSVSGDKVHQIDSSGKAPHQGAHELFSKTDFWDELESFLLDPKGCYLIMKSRTREQLLRRLQNEGPPSLKELDNNHLSHLGDILFLEKKWVEQSSSPKSPFKLVITAKKKFVTSQPSHSNGLSSFFPAKTKFNSQKPQDQEKEEQRTGPPSREEILSDCRKLLKELLEKNPTGFSISTFQPEFVRKYYYILDYQTLGYPKLAALLQIMPGIRIENSYIRPSEILHSEPKEVAEEVEDEKGKEALIANSRLDDSAWDELGPVSNDHPYSPVSLSDDEYTDSEEEILSPSDGSRNSQKRLEDSSMLLKILDSWDNSMGEGKEKHRDVRPSNVGEVGLHRLKMRASSKSYSFVTQHENDKEYFAERILGEVKKAGDSRLKG